MIDKYEHARANAQNWYNSIVEMVEALAQADANGDGIAQDSARDAITESVLSVEVRSDWYTLDNADHEPAEYRILLTTGGPALQLTGALSEHGEPETAELRMQDWGLPWQAWWPPLQADGEPTAAQTLLNFARCFYFGE